MMKAKRLEVSSTNLSAQEAQDPGGKRPMPAAIRKDFLHAAGLPSVRLVAVRYCPMLFSLRPLQTPCRPAPNLTRKILAVAFRFASCFHDGQTFRLSRHACPAVSVRPFVPPPSHLSVLRKVG